MTTTHKNIISVTSDGDGPSRFSIRKIDLNGDDSWSLSEQQSALNFRLRSSAAGYNSTWHVAGDPTLLIITSGAIEIQIRSGETHLFEAGDMFIAEDFLIVNTEFSDIHGHRAKVVGQQTLQALHLKLKKRT